jgi:hypothetical protein
MATFSLKASEAKTGTGKVITWNKADDFMIVEIGGAKKVVHKSLGERLIAQKKATKAAGELVDNTKAHKKKVEKLNEVKK